MYSLEEIEQLVKDGKITLQQANALIANSPEQQKRIQEMKVAQERGERVAVSQGVMDLLKNIGYMGFALDQIGTANRMRPTVPSIPQVPGLSPEITQAIYEAQRGVSAMPALEASRQGIEDAYTGSLNRAEAASGGQAGAYQAMAQAANIERLRAQLGLAPVAQQIQMQNQGNLNTLLGARSDERQQDYMNRLYGSQLQFDQYNRAAEAIGGLGAAGRTNMLDSAGRITDSINSLTPYFVGFDKDTQDYANKVRAENVSNMMPPSRNPMENYTGIYEPYYGRYSQAGRRDS